MRPAQTTLIHFLTRVGVSVVGFIGTVYLTNALNAGVYGTYVVVVALISWANIPTSAVNTAIRKRVSESDEKAGFLSAGLVLNLFIAGSVGILVLAGETFLTDYVGKSVTIWLLLMIFGYVLFGTTTAGLDGQHKVEYSGLLTFVEQTLRAGFQVGLIVAGLGLVGALLGYGFSFLLAALLGLAFYDVWITIPRRRHFSRILEYAKYSWIGGVKSKVAGPVIDALILNLFVASSFVGIYQAAWNLASMLVMVSGSIQSTLFPEISMYSAEGDYKQVRELLEEGLIFTGLFAIPGFFGAILVGPNVLQVYGSEFARGGTILVILIVARTVSAFGSQFVSAINGVDRPDLAFRTNIALIVTNLGLNFVLIPIIGWYGAAIATAVSAFVMLAIAYYYFRDLIGRVRPPIREIANQLVASVIMVAVLLVSLSVVSLNNILSTVFVVLLGAGVYSAVLLISSIYIRKKLLSVLPKI